MPATGPDVEGPLLSSAPPPYNGLQRGVLARPRGGEVGQAERPPVSRGGWWLCVGVQRGMHVCFGVTVVSDVLHLQTQYRYRMVVRRSGAKVLAQGAIDCAAVMGKVNWSSSVIAATCHLLPHEMPSGHCHADWQPWLPCDLPCLRRRTGRGRAAQRCKGSGSAIIARPGSFVAPDRCSRDQ